MSLPLEGRICGNTYLIFMDTCIIDLTIVEFEIAGVNIGHENWFWTNSFTRGTKKSVFDFFDTFHALAQSAGEVVTWLTGDHLEDEHIAPESN